MADAQSTTSPSEYREISRLPGYRLGSDGSLWSRLSHRKTGPRFTDHWTKLATTVHTTTGYYMADLSVNKTQCKIYVHALMLEAFIGPRPTGMVCCHFDGNKLNNRIENLRWDTRVSNKADERRHGTNNAGSRHGLSKLTESDIPKIREMRSRGEVYRSIAERFGVTETSIRRVIRRDTWTHV